MTPKAMAVLHARCFTTPRPFSAYEIAALLDDPAVISVLQPAGFALGRVVLDEVDLITLAVSPDHRRMGVGRRMLGDFEAAAAARGGQRVFLEVAADNTAALALYTAAGYRQTGVRPRYYRCPDGQRIDAVLMDKAVSEA